MYLLVVAVTPRGQLFVRGAGFHGSPVPGYMHQARPRTHTHPCFADCEVQLLCCEFNITAVPVTAVRLSATMMTAAGNHTHDEYHIISYHTRQQQYLRYYDVQQNDFYAVSIIRSVYQDVRSYVSIMLLLSTTGTHDRPSSQLNTPGGICWPSLGKRKAHKVGGNNNKSPYTKHFVL